MALRESLHGVAQSPCSAGGGEIDSIGANLHQGFGWIGRACWHG